MERLGSDEHVFHGFLAVGLVAVCHFLAGDAIGGPGYSVEALLADVFLAVEADAVGAFFDAEQSATHVAEQGAVAVEVANGKFALGGVLDFIQSVGAFSISMPSRLTITRINSASFFLRASLYLLSSCLVIVLFSFCLLLSSFTANSFLVCSPAYGDPDWESVALRTLAGCLSLSAQVAVVNIYSTKKIDGSFKISSGP